MAKKILIFYVGGTIGMVASDQGYAPAGSFADQAQSLFSKLPIEDAPVIQLRIHPNPIDSANVQPNDWLRIANDIRKEKSAFDGFIVLHGTDTMAFTGSALSFLLGDLEKPVILTGSMIPLFEAGSDAPDNLLNAVKAASCTRLNETCILIGKTILRANRTTKSNSKGLKPFVSPNCPPLGIVRSKVTLRRSSRRHAPLAKLDRNLPRSMSAAVVVQPFFPGIGQSDFTPLLRRRLDAIVLQCYGQGTGPTNDPALLGCLRHLVQQGVIIVAVTQCLQGGVDLTVYAAGMALRQAGVIDGGDMTLEAAYTKLHWLLVQGFTSQKVASMVCQDLRGELTPK